MKQIRIVIIGILVVATIDGALGYFVFFPAWSNYGMIETPISQALAGELTLLPLGAIHIHLSANSPPKMVTIVIVPRPSCSPCSHDTPASTPFLFQVDWRPSAVGFGIETILEDQCELTALSGGYCRTIELRGGAWTNFVTNQSSTLTDFDLRFVSTLGGDYVWIAGALGGQGLSLFIPSFVTVTASTFPIACPILVVTALVLVFMDRRKVARDNTKVY